MIRKTSIVALGLVTVLALSACGTDPSAGEIVEAMTEAMGAVDTYRYEAGLTFMATGVEAGEPVDMSLTMDLSGALDLTNRQMQTDITMEAAISGEDPDIQELGMEMYLVDDVMYMHTQLPEMGNLSMWLKSEIPEGQWEQLNQVESQVQLLEAAQVTVAGSEKVDSVDCYLLQIVPDMAQLWETLMAQGQAAGGAWPEMPIEDDLLDITSFSVRQWIAKDTYYLMKAEIDVTMSMSAETAGLSDEEGDIEFEFTVALLAHDYNRPVSIELPAEAEDAMDMSTFDGFLGEGEAEAQGTELANTQAAVTSMMVDNELWQLTNPVSVPTDDMTAFPDTSTVASGDKALDLDGNPFASGDKDGFILFGHDMVADDDQSSTVNYVAVSTTTYRYTVDASGIVTQHLTPPR